MQIQFFFVNGSQNKPVVFPSADAYKGKILPTTMQAQKKKNAINNNIEISKIPKD